MSASVEPQTEPIEEEPLDSSTSDTIRIVYGKSSSSGMTGSECALGKGAVTDLATLRTAHEAGLARAERREVVVVHVALALGHVDRVETLPLGEHAERQHGEHLGLAASEEAVAVRARQVAGDAVDLADVGEASAVGALALVEDHGAHRLLLELLEERLDVLAVGLELLLGERREDLVLDGGDSVHAGVLVRVVECIAHLVLAGAEDAIAKSIVDGVQRNVHRRHVALGDEALLRVAELADRLHGELERGEHVLLADLVGAGLDHVDGVA